MSLTAAERELVGDVAGRGYSDDLEGRALTAALVSLRRDLAKVTRALKKREDDAGRLTATRNILMHHLARLTQRLPGEKKEDGDVHGV